ncbi:MAG: 6-carboxytetrahydropterin synthase [Lachnospiraceae bacterium]
MRYSQYKFNFYLNASHAIYINGELGASHPHTWEIIVKTIKSQKGFMLFHEVEKKIEQFLDPFQNKFLNDFSPFDVMNPTLENITAYLLEQLDNILEPLGWIIFYIEIAETPTRSYIISRVENNIISDLQMKNIVTNIIDHGFNEE